jgi:hypothetical protein
MPAQAGTQDIPDGPDISWFDSIGYTSADPRIQNWLDLEIGSMGPASMGFHPSSWPQSVQETRLVEAT